MKQTDINTPKTYWNGALAGQPNLVYNKFVNMDIVGPTYSHFGQRKKPTSFYLEKRKGYREFVDASYRWAQEGYFITDAVRIGDAECVDSECFEYFFLKKKDGSHMRIMGKSCGSCSEFIQVYQGDFCSCGYDKFVETDWARGIPRYIRSSVSESASNAAISATGVEFNKTVSNITSGIFYDSGMEIFFASNNEAQVGDYVFVHGAQNYNTISCGLTRQILNIRMNAEGTYDYMDMSNTWTDIIAETGNTGSYGGAHYSIFPEWGKVLMFATLDGIHIIHSPYSYIDDDGNPAGTPFVTTLCDYTISGTGEHNCVTGLANYRDRVNVMFANGYNMSGGGGFDKMYFSVDSYNPVGADKITSVGFRNFLLAFGKNSIYTLVQQPTGLNQGYELTNSLGIWSTNAHTIFENSLYFFASDKRLYALGIQGDGDTYALNLQDMSDSIRGDLDMIQDTDEVHLYADGHRLIIFINGKINPSDNYNNKTKMLIFWKDYSTWTEHHIAYKISGKKGKYYIGDGLFTYCGDQDGGRYVDPPINGEQYIYNYYDAYVDAFIGEQENNGLEISAYARKTINWAKVILGRGIYTNNNTVFTVDQYGDGYKTQYNVSNVQSISWIRQNNLLASTNEVVMPDQCILDNLDDCNSIVRPCEGSGVYIQDTKTDCNCSPEVKMQDDYITCVDDKGYALSEIFTLHIPLADTTRESELFRIRIYSKGGDKLVFGGMILELEQQPLEKNNPDDGDILIGDSCDKVEYCE